jgi:hypothetical protein
MRNSVFALAAILALGSLSDTSDAFARGDHSKGGHGGGHGPHIGGGPGTRLGDGHGLGGGPGPHLGGERQFYHARW